MDFTYIFIKKNLFSRSEPFGHGIFGSQKLFASPTLLNQKKLNASPVLKCLHCFRCFSDIQCTFFLASSSEYERTMRIKHRHFTVAESSFTLHVSPSDSTYVMGRGISMYRRYFIVFFPPLAIRRARTRSRPYISCAVLCHVFTERVHNTSL